MSDNLDEPLDQEKFLEEIRRRAEEAELARIEAEELKLSAQLSDDASANSQSVAASGGQSGASPSNILKSESKSLEGVLFLKPRYNGLPDYLSPKVGETGWISNAKQDQSPRFRRSAASFLQSAQEHYQNERYDAALADLRDAETHEPDNPEISRLRNEIVKAKELAERIAAEERAHHQERGFVETFDSSASNEAPEIKPPVIIEARTTEPAAPELSPETKASASKHLAAIKLFALVILIGLGIAAAYVTYSYVKKKYFPGTVRVLVLPARTSSAETYLADGMTEELIMHLGHVPRLEIIAPRTALSLRSSTRSKAVEVLEVDYILQLKTEHRGERISLLASLSEASAGREEFLQEVSAPHDEIAGLCAAMVPPIASALGAEANPEVRHDTRGESFDAYLRGRFALRSTDAFALDSAVSAFEQSCRSEPRFPSAEVALGWARLLQYETAPASAEERLLAAENHMRRAINLGGHTAEVYRLWGTVAYYKRKYDEAIERLATATRLSPSDAEAHRRLALAYLHSAQLDPALAAASTSVSLDPYNPPVRVTYGLLLMLKEENEQALLEFEASKQQQANADSSLTKAHLAALVAVNNHEHALQILHEQAKLEPRNYQVQYDLGRMYQLAGKPKTMWSEALEQARQIILHNIKADSADATQLAYLGLVETRLGNFGEGTAAADRALAKAPNAPEIRYLVARVFSLQRDKINDGFNYLAAAVKERLQLSELVDLDLQNLRADPNFLQKVVL